MSRGLRNNNPGNIRHDGVKWRGELVPSGDAAFKRFESMAWGYRAMFHLIHNYYRLHGCRTLRAVVSRWAPPSDGNDTRAYIGAVSRDAGIDPDARLDTACREVMIPVVMAMSRVENGVAAVRTDVEAGWKMFIKYRI